MFNKFDWGLSFSPIRLGKFHKAAHPYHLVGKSPWPVIASVRGAIILAGLIVQFHRHSLSRILRAIRLLTLATLIWCLNVIKERQSGYHTSAVQARIKIGIVLFIISEIIFFFSFFWAFFHRRVSPAVELGGRWPPSGIQVFQPFRVPILNTVILLSRGVRVTWSHHRLLGTNQEYYFSSIFPWNLKAFQIHSMYINRVGKLHRRRREQREAYKEQLISYIICLEYFAAFSHIKNGVEISKKYYDLCREYFEHKRARHEKWISYTEAFYRLILTIILGVYFSLIQIIEYLESSFTIADGVYGRTFFIATGFHGFHVLLGSTGLLFCAWRLYSGQFSPFRHIGIEATIWYWHFVDVVWLFLFIFIYWWGRK